LIVLRHSDQPREIQEIVCAIILILLLNQYFLSVVNPLVLFHGASMVLWHRHTKKNSYVGSQLRNTKQFRIWVSLNDKRLSITLGV